MQGALGREIDRMEARMRRSCRKEENAARLVTIPGVRPIAASAINGWCAKHIGVPLRSGFRGVAWPRTQAKLKRREGPARADHQDGRPDDTAIAGDGSSSPFTAHPCVTAAIAPGLPARDRC